MRAAAAAAGLLSACSLAPAPGGAPGSAPAEPPGGSFAGEDAPAPESSGPLTLEMVLRLADRRSLDLGLAAQAAREAEALASESALSMLPRLAAGAGYRRHDGRTQSTEGVFEDVLKQQSFAGLGLRLSLRPGEAVFRSAAAADLARGAVLRAEAARLTARFAAAHAFFDLLRAGAAARIAGEDLAHSRGLEDWSRSRVRHGAALTATLERARARRAAAEIAQAAAREAQMLASLELGRILRLPGPHPLSVAENLPPAAPLQAAGLDLLAARALARRPDLQAAGFRVDAAEDELRRTRWEWIIPSLELEAATGGLGGTLGGLERRTTYSAALTWELGLHQSARTDAASARVRQAELRRALLRQAVRAEVGAALAARDSAQARLAASAVEEQAARAALELAEARLRNGAGLFLEVLDARRALSAGEGHAAQAAIDLAEASLALRLALGEP